MFTDSLRLIIPELLILTGACASLFAGMHARNYVIAYSLAQLSILSALIYLLLPFEISASVSAFNGFYVSDGLARIVKIGLCLFTLFVFLYARTYVNHNKLPGGEFFALCLFALLGMLMMASAAHMLSLYLSLELLSLSLYPLIALQRDHRICSEAAMKYFVLGAIASGILLYGISWLYGLTGSLYLADIQLQLQAIFEQQPTAAVAALLFIVVGIAFKLGAAPFHLWLPDVYQGAPYAVALFIASVTKLAAFMMAYRLLVDGAMSMYFHWKPVLAVLAIISLILGNLVAIVQSNIRRMLAYSAIAHVGFILLGFVAGHSMGFGASLFYTLIYVLMGLGVFGVLTVISEKGSEVENIQDLQGLSASRPWLAFLMLILLFSMAGIPMTAGFYAKFSVLQALLNDQQIWLAVVAVVATVIGAYYYLRVIKVMYFDSPVAECQVLPSAGTSVFVMIALTINTAAVVLLFLFPQSLILVCRQVFG